MAGDYPTVTVDPTGGYVGRAGGFTNYATGQYQTYASVGGGQSDQSLWSIITNAAENAINPVGEIGSSLWNSISPSLPSPVSSALSSIGPWLLILALLFLALWFFKK